jgi:GR25 family glycosyltransferase involved in LPS biosynthesis
MNLLPRQPAIASYFFRLRLFLRRFMHRQRCNTFGVKREKGNLQIEKIYVINLDRATSRWSKMKQELKNILDTSGIELLNLTERIVAVDANNFIEEPTKDAQIDPIYTLSDQLFVEPQPLTLPTKLELNAPIRMSRAECAVARSHINIWEKVVDSNYEYVLILEDDVWFHSDFARYLDKAWKEVLSNSEIKGSFDVLYLSYHEVKHGAPKVILSKNLFRPERGLWHLSGYVLSRGGAEKLIRQLPCRGPVDLWINHQFKVLDILATKQSLISQRRDIKSSNLYSILPSLTKIGAITCEGASMFNIRPIEQPVFAFGSEGSDLSSLAMALSMLGYRCCSDFNDLPVIEMQRLLDRSEDRVFNAYVNIGSLDTKVTELLIRYPKAKYIITSAKGTRTDYSVLKMKDNLDGADLIILPMDKSNKWQVVCEHLRCAPPRCSFPELQDIGQRPIINEIFELNKVINLKNSKHDNSPWVVEYNKWWQGIRSISTEGKPKCNGERVKITDSLEFLDTMRWLIRSDTFTDNLALFRPSNVKFNSDGAVLTVKREPLGVRDYTAASICSRDQYLYGRFEANIQASNLPGVVTGFFLHRNSPRQEIDVEIPGNRPDLLLVNVFFNPGNEDASFDYGYRGTPSYIDLGFDASKASHRYAIEWSQNEIRWFVDDIVVHRRVVWDPTPIPHLPMTLHANNWVTRSTQLAGQIKNRNLPTVSIFRNISIEAITRISRPKANDPLAQEKPSNINSSHSVK